MSGSPLGQPSNVFGTRMSLTRDQMVEKSMPFKSSKQRALFHAAKNDPKLRKQLGLSLKVIKEFLAGDEGGKLPTVASKTNKAMRADYEANAY